MRDSLTGEIRDILDITGDGISAEWIKLRKKDPSIQERLSVLSSNSSIDQ